MGDSSSSSDEEEKAKLKSAAWPSFTSVTSPKGIASVTTTQPKQSLRNTADLGEQRDYRNVDATPQLKAFIANKLSSWLDSSISVIDVGDQTTKAAQDGEDDDFQLFSTSRRGLSEDEPQPEGRKRRPPPSSSDSDSDEERAKLASVAISYSQIFQSSLSSASQDNQVTSNLSPTNNLSTLTSADPSQPNVSVQEIDLKSENQKKRCLEGSDGAEDVGDSCPRNGRKKKKRKKRKKGMIRDCMDQETVPEASLPTAIKMDHTGEHRLDKLPTNIGNGNKSPVEQSEQTLKKKRKKKKKKLKKDQDPACIAKQNNLEMYIS